MPRHQDRSPARRATWAAACLLAGLWPLAQAVAETPPPEKPAVRHSLNTGFLSADPRHWEGVFERPGREVFDKRFQIVAATGVRPGMTVADVGAGTGLFTVLFARAVGPRGKVYAVDISKRLIASIRKRAADYHVANVESVVSGPKDTLLAKDSVDLVFVCDTYHHFEYPLAMLKSIARALRPNGELVVVDYRRIPGESTPWVMSHVRAGEEDVTREIEAAGFKLVGKGELLRTNYLLRFRKPGEE
jgi:predicted methyltransferase